MACHIYKAGYSQQKHFSSLLKSTSYKLQQACNMSTTVNPQFQRPLVILLPWLGATQKATEKYISLYKNLDCDVVSRQSQLKDFLWPKLGLKESSKFLSDIQKNMPSAGRPILIHSMSIGSYFYALMLMCFESEPDNFFNISSNIRCQVVDSPVVGTLNEMSFGVAQMLTKSKAAHKALQYFTNIYFATTTAHTVKYYKQSIDVFKHRPPRVPSLIMSSDNDPMMLSYAIKELETAWLKQGVGLTLKMWDNSGHAQHLKNHPEEYESLIRLLVKKNL